MKPLAALVEAGAPLPSWYRYIQFPTWDAGPFGECFKLQVLYFRTTLTNQLFFDTPWKINMEPTNLPFRKENDLPNLHYYVPC